MVLTPDEWRAVDALFHAASRLPNSARRGYVAACAANDPALADIVMRLLTAAEASGPLDGGIGAVVDDLLSS